MPPLANVIEKQGLEAQEQKSTPTHKPICRIFDEPGGGSVNAAARTVGAFRPSLISLSASPDAATIYIRPNASRQEFRIAIARWKVV